MAKDKMKFKTKYGYFTEDGKEYVITRPDLPRPWVNVIANNVDYGLTISQTGSGSSWWGNSNLARITRWEQDIIKDEWGKYIYIRDNETKKYWSLGWKPVCAPFEFYECRHGIGYTTISSKTNGIESKMTIFVPPDETLELWIVTIKNTAKKDKKLSVTSYFEWCLGNFQDTHREFQKTFISTEFDKDLNALIGNKKKALVPRHISSGMSEWPISGFHSVSEKVNSYDGDKETFLGMYRGHTNPVSVEKGGALARTTGFWGDSVAALRLNINLKKGQEKTLVFTVGYMESYEKAKALVRKYTDVKVAESALDKTKKYWQDLLNGMMVDTPDDAFNFMTNYWLRYQAISARMRGRSAYYQSSGGYGFRDQLQDSLACLPADPKITRSQLLLHAAHQFADGTVHHWWHPLTERGHHTEMTDDLLWLAYITLFYLKETKDFSILDEKAIYLDAPEGDLYDHCCRAIDKVFTRFSPRGLPLIGEGDWNDGMNMVGLHWKGESIWLGHFLYGILMDFSHICGLRNDTNRKSEYLNKAELLKKSINEYAWDGDWYLGATKDNGELMGSKQCKEGKIFLNAQSWAVFNDVATPERAKKCMESVERILDLKYGPLLATPAYTVPDETIGYVTRYAAGIRENGGVYTHGACWAIKAECYMKNNKRAYSMYSRISPVRRGLDPDMYRVEPYVTPGNTDGPESPFFGRGGWTWYTGSGAWLYNVSTDWILGIRATYEGLLIDPCIPREWPGYKARRVFRKAAYNIEVVNSRDGSGDIRCVELDGKKQKSNLIPDLSDNKTHEVKIIMGAKNDLAEKRTKKAELAKCN